jgi:hypothetical protein
MNKLSWKRLHLTKIRRIDFFFLCFPSRFIGLLNSIVFMKDPQAKKKSAFVLQLEEDLDKRMPQLRSCRQFMC